MQRRMTPDQADEILLAKPEDIKVSVVENGETVLEGTLPEYGIKIDTEGFHAALEDVFTQQTTNIVHAVKAMNAVDELTVDVPYTSFVPG